MEFGRVRVFLKSGAMERLIEEGNKLAIVNANVDFKGQALLDDRLIIETSFTIEGIRICFDQKIFRVEPEPRILITKGINSVVVINSKQKPVKPPQYLIQAMNNLIIK
jgi:acyl-CoA thioesterase FadM